jgi:hypothetical protein
MAGETVADTAARKAAPAAQHLLVIAHSLKFTEQ